MYSFKNDYSEGFHPNILNALIKSNLEQCEGYGNDKYSLKAIELLKEKFELENSDIHFFVGGTQTNLTAISAFLRPYEAVISAESGHVAVHETGAIESTGHKVITTPSNDGKLYVDNIKSVLDTHTDEHMVYPKLVYISNPTEVGTIYTKVEIETLSNFCKENKLIFYIDGARLGCALCSNKNDLELADLGKLSDAFYIGATKNGALFGEALVICNDSLKDNFRFNIKQKGGLLAKGRALGIQFYELFKDNLYFELSTHANKMAELLSNAISSLGYKFLVDSNTNQLFPILPNEIIGLLEEKYLFYRWEKVDSENTAIRLVTSWATSEDKVNDFIKDIKNFTKE
ncbi:aminotransferase class I/II-fold pyridoxal phosphate-dependent enzyme (plasmid) [Paraclostridium ghonii]|uniref:threonine aldolase family protein n=1 Tax=Paraclostridium ghonii TaxID=29358 RepID=UPI00202CE02B|nr:aminotransferase class I/II-fold pyridoxal phosphate-dependent enzyme [Paeniclostridium ghonii]MCM0167576.1 aminotransferase class I/II-fold pyridoxal phosphate-dependent enzyme [Paeniclostridium ghonii]